MVSSNDINWTVDESLIDILTFSECGCKKHREYTKVEILGIWPKLKLYINIHKVIQDPDDIVHCHPLRAHNVQCDTFLQNRIKHNITYHYMEKNSLDANPQKGYFCLFQP